MDIKYSLLETTLSMLDGIKYLPNFKKKGIEASVLPLLTDEDLKIIGVDDEQLRNQFINQCSSLPSLSDSRLDVAVNEKYLMTVLHEIDQHLLLLDASLTYALKRKDIQFCDIGLYESSKCLVTCTDSMLKELRDFHYFFAPRKYKKKNRWMVALLTIISASVTGLFFRKYLTSR